MSAARATGRRTAAQLAGGAAEEHAARFLAERGLAIVARNYRTRLGEIDVVARDGDTIVFVEVRLRSSDRYGGAAQSVDGAKQHRLVAAARHFLMGFRRAPPCRFDVVTLGPGEIAWLRAAFDLD